MNKPVFLEMDTEKNFDFFFLPFFLENFFLS